MLMAPRDLVGVGTMIYRFDLITRSLHNLLSRGGAGHVECECVIWYGLYAEFSVETRGRCDQADVLPGLVRSQTAE